MCTAFVHNGADTIFGFNFDVDPAVWQHKLILRPDLFCIGIRVKNQYQPIHGVNANGTASALLYIPECEAGKYRRSPSCFRIDLLSERVIRGALSFDDACETAARKTIVNVPNCSMHTLISDRNGRALLVEPGIGLKVEHEPFSLMTNYSVLAPESTRDKILPGDDRYERALEILKRTNDKFSVEDAFALLHEVRQEGIWATRVSFVFSVRRNTVYFVRDNQFGTVAEHKFA